MKKSLIALAVAAGSIAAAQADTTTLYGSLGFSSVISQTDSSHMVSGTWKSFKNNHWDIKTSAAKIGVKGTEDFGNGTQAFFKFEFGTKDPVTGTYEDENGEEQSVTVNDGLSTVNYAYIGFKGDFGTVTIGKQKSLFKAVTDTGLFNDVGIGYDFNGNYPGTVSKAVSYVTPESAGIQFGASVVADNTNWASLSADVWEVAAMYNVDGWNTGIVYSNAGQGYKEYKDGKVKAHKTGTQEFIGLNVGYSTDQYNVVGRAVHESSVSTEYGIEGEYKDGANTYRAGFGVHDPEASGAKNDYNFALGYQYNFSERTYTWVEGQYTKYGKVDGQKVKNNGFQALVGVRHDF